MPWRWLLGSWSLSMTPAQKQVLPIPLQSSLLRRSLVSDSHHTRITNFCPIGQTIIVWHSPLQIPGIMKYLPDCYHVNPMIDTTLFVPFFPFLHTLSLLCYFHEFWKFIIYIFWPNYKEINPANGRHWISRPMWIVSPLPLREEKTWWGDLF